MSIRRDATYNLAAAVTPALFTLVVVPFYLHVIGPERFGILAICWTIVAALGFASLGMGPALTFRLARMARAPVSARSSMFWTALFLGVTGALVGASLVIVLGEAYFQYFFHASSVIDAEIWQALPVLAALLPFGVAIGVLSGALQGTRHFGALSALGIVNAALVAFAPLATALLISKSLRALITTTVMSNGAVVVIELIVCSRLLPLQLPRSLTRSDIKALLHYGAWMSGTALIAPVVMLLDRLIIGALRGPTSVATYVLPYNLVQQLLLLPASFSSAMVPRLAALPNEEVQRLQSATLIWLNGVLTPLSIIAIALAGPFLHFWIGPTLANNATPVAAILLVGGWVHGIGHIPSTVLIGRSRPDLLTKLLFVYFAPYVVALYLATLHFGIIGAAAAWTIRAAFDPILFLYTKPYASDLRRVGFCALLVLSAMIAALALSWTSMPYWTLMVIILATACFLSRKVVFSSADNLRLMAFGDRNLTGPPPCAF